MKGRNVKRPKILFVAQDIGAFNALVPAVEKMRRRWKVLAVLAGVSRRTARKRGLKFCDAGSIARKELENLVLDFGPDAVLAGTSGGRSVDKIVLEIAGKRGIPTVSFVDFWTNYAARFKQNRLPDHIMVVDRRMKKEMVAEGFPSEKFVVVGDPRFDAQPSYSSFRPRCGKPTVLFVDQPLKKLIVAGWHKNYGYDELVVFRHLLEALEKMRFDGKILIKFHPATRDLRKYDKIGKDFKIRLAFVRSGSENAVKSADLIFGATSAFLLEAALAGKIVVSYQPGLLGGGPIARWATWHSPPDSRKIPFGGQITEIIEK